MREEADYRARLNAKFIIYAIKCNCGRMYIGETTNLRTRMNLHKEQIKYTRYRKLFSSKHIFSCKEKFNFIPIFSCKDENQIARKNLEHKFIDKYHPSLNRDG